MMVQKEHWKGQPRPASKQEGGRGDVTDVRQVLHVIVEGAKLAPRGVHYGFLEALLGLARVNANAEILRAFDVGRDLRQHGEAAGHVKAADQDLHARLAQRPRDVDGAGEFIGLHADDPDQAEAAVLLDEARDLARAHTGIGLVHGVDVDGKVGAKQLALGGALGQAVDGSKRVRRHGRAQPLHDIAVRVVMGRLDQDDLESLRRRARCAQHPSIPMRGELPRERLE